MHKHIYNYFRSISVIYEKMIQIIFSILVSYLLQRCAAKDHPRYSCDVSIDNNYCKIDNLENNVLR